MQIEKLTSHIGAEISGINLAEAITNDDLFDTIGQALLTHKVLFLRDQQISKAEHVGQAVPSMAFSSQLMTVAADAPWWLRILAATVNWLDSMKIGMTFGVLFGALLHTVLRYYPLKVGRNLYLNSLKGALVGMPMGVCANCAVPTACGVRAVGRAQMDDQRKRLHRSSDLP